MSGFAYSNNGLSFRAVDSAAECQSGEVYFAETPTMAQLQAAFTGYNAAISAQEAQATYAAAVTAGLTITSTGTPALDGTYALDQASQENIIAEQVCINTNGLFTNGQSTRAWPDKAGVFHTFPSIAEFKTFAIAVAAYVDALDGALAAAEQGGSPSWPSASVTIA